MAPYFFVQGCLFGAGDSFSVDAFCPFYDRSEFADFCFGHILQLVHVCSFRGKEDWAEIEVSQFLYHIQYLRVWG